MGITKQREKILNTISGSDSHLTAEQIYDRVKTEFPNISVGTVYRNLSILADNNEIQRLYIPGEPVRFDRSVNPHEHLVCVRCGSITDVPAVNVKLPGHLLRTDIKVLRHTLVVHCICAECLKTLQQC